MTITIKAHLPEGTKGIAYAKNHHWIELVDEEGNTHRLPATALVMYRCSKCSETWFRTINRGSTPCLECGYDRVEPVWRVPQLAFVPEDSSEFKSPPQKDAKE